jgi:hypothetical protein
MQVILPGGEIEVQRGGLPTVTQLERGAVGHIATMSRMLAVWLALFLYQSFNTRNNFWKVRYNIVTTLQTRRKQPQRGEGICLPTF